MQVTLKYTGQLAGAAGTSEESVECQDGEPLLRAVQKLAGDGRDQLYRQLVLNGEGCFQPTVLMVVEGEQLSGSKDSYIPKAGEAITLMTPIAGG